MCYHKDLSSPSTIEIPGGLKTGHQITINGKVSDTMPRFSFNFQKTQQSGCDIGMHFNPRNDTACPVVVRNSYQNGWKLEETDTPSFPFGNGHEFTIRIHVTSASYVVYVNTEFYIEFNHRMDHHDMNYLRLTDGADWHDVNIREAARVPHTRPLHLSEGMSVNVTGLIHTDASRFEINFDCDANHDTIGLHFNPRQNQSDTVLNTFKDGYWGPEERGYPNFPFTQGEFFSATFTAHNGSFIICVNGEHFTNYVYRVPLGSIQFLRIIGDVDIMGVTASSQDLSDWVRPIHGGLHDDDMISVVGFFKPSVDRFQVNLLTGLDTSSQRAIHIDSRRGQGEVVLNSTVAGVWQTEVKYPLPSSLHEPCTFVINIVNRASDFEIFFKGKKLGVFPHRLSVSSIQSVFCSGGAYIYSIQHHHKLASSHCLKIPRTAVTGDWARVIGIPHDNADRFLVDLQADNGDIPFHYNARHGAGQTVRNTLAGGAWGHEERTESSFPFDRTNMFEVAILTTDDRFKVVANRHHHIDYMYRLPMGATTQLCTGQDADFYVKDFW